MSLSSLGGVGFDELPSPGRREPPRSSSVGIDERARAAEAPIIARTSGVLLIGREDHRDHLHLVREPLRKGGGSDGRWARGEDLALERPSSRLETAGDLPGGVGTLAILDQEGKKPAVRDRSGGRDRRHEDDRSPRRHGGGSVCLLSDAAGLDSNRFAADGDFALLTCFDAP
jgi:hypothetical protein